MISKKEFLQGIVVRKTKQERLQFINLIRTKLEFEKNKLSLPYYENYLRKVNYYDYMITNNRPILIDTLEIYKTPSLDQF
jgi:hypothetical protein